jgi:hypothetical protein
MRYCEPIRERCSTDPLLLGRHALFMITPKQVDAKPSTANFNMIIILSPMGLLE